MASHYAIKVYARRGNQPPYCYFQYKNVRASKAQWLAWEAADDIAAHEGRSGMFTSVTRYPTGAVVLCEGNRFVVRMSRLS